MTTDNPKCEVCNGTGFYLVKDEKTPLMVRERCLQCGFGEPVKGRGIPPESARAINGVVAGSPIPSEPERCKCSGEVFDKGNGICGVCDKYFDFVTPPNKPISSEPKCEHDKGQWWNNEETKAYFQKSLAGNICPFCKPVEPSVESIAFALVHKFSIYTEDGTFFSNNEPNAPKKLELLIAEALRNERNKHG